MKNTKTIGILAHVDAGKTTFTEQLLYHTKSIKQRGRVDHQDAFLDSHFIEKERGITVFSDQGLFYYNGTKYYVIDTPGHIDFSPEMERSIQVLDYAIVILSAVEGVEGHTETVWRLLRKHHVPTFFFINKTDRIGANVDQVLQEISMNLTEQICEMTESFNQGVMKDELIEFIALKDEVLLEKYLEKGYEEDLWLKTMKAMIKKNIIFPCASGSALQDVGIIPFIEKLDLLTETDYKDNEAFSGRVYKIRYDENNARVAFIKALSGTLKVRDDICYTIDANTIFEKVTQIRSYNGKKYENVNQVSAGDIFAVTGLSNVFAGDGIGTLLEKASYDLVPTLKSKVIFDSPLNVKDVLKHFQMLDEEDPSLQVTWDERFQEIHINIMGMIQLEILEQIVKDRFNYTVSFGKPEILYKETIETAVTGYGHFEPLRHYAEVHLKLEPAKRNSGLSFVNACHANDLTTGYQNQIYQHLFEKDHRGLLTGSPLTDIKITLLTGRAHNKHTSGGDFKEATLRALRQGLEKAQNDLLEPFYDFKIKVHLNHLGRVLTDIQSAYGRFNPPEIKEDQVVITGCAPVATFMNYSVVFASFTKGKGTLNMVFGGYHRCHNEEEMIKIIDYQKHMDPDYTSSSIFCSKGQSISFTWDEAEDKMHCEFI